MTISNIWPLIFLIFVPLIILLYILKQKAEDYMYSSTFLWQEVYKNMEVNTPFEKLKKNLLLLLQILIVLFLIIALMNPSLLLGNKNFKNIVVVIDNSGSMNTLYHDKTTRLDEAKIKASEYVRKQSNNTNFTILSASDTIKLEVSATKDKTLAMGKIKNIKETDLISDVDNNVAIIKTLINQWESYQVVYFTDDTINLEDVNAEVVSLATQSNNLSLDYMNHIEEDGMIKALVKITSHSHQKTTTDINIYDDDKLLDVQEVTIEPKETKSILFDGLKFSGSFLKAEINENDDLKNDNITYDVVRQKNKIKVLLVSQKNIFLEKALKTLPSIEVYKTNDIDIMDESEKYDIYIYDNITPDKLPEKGNIIFFNPSNTMLFAEAGTKENGIATAEKSQITKYIEDLNIIIREYKNLDRPKWATSFMKIDNQSVAFFGQYNAQQIGVFAFDLHSTDLGLKPEFPVLIHNVINQMMNTGILIKNNYVAGEQVSFNPSSKGSDLTITLPDGKDLKMQLQYPMKEFNNTSMVGIYKVSQEVNNKKQTEIFAVNYPNNQEINNQVDSNIKSNNKTDISKGYINLQIYLIITLIVLLFVEWIIYLRRY